MMTGDSYRVPIKLETANGIANPDTFEDIEVMFGDIRKTLSEGGIEYDAEKERFLIPLSQKETFRCKGDVNVQIRCKFADGSVVGISAGTYNVEKSTSKVVL